MPIIKQAKKRVKQARVRQARNYNVRTAVRKAIRAVNDAIKAGDKAAAEKALVTAQKAIDMAAKKGVLQSNTASRRKSRLARDIAGMGAKKEAAPAKKTTAKKAPAKKAAPKKETAKKEEEKAA
jgi:small subunit ribosomal protein S20